MRSRETGRRKKTHRELARTVQGLDLVYAVADALEQLVEAFFRAHLFRRVQDQHRIGRHVVVDLQTCARGRRKVLSDSARLVAGA